MRCYIKALLRHSTATSKHCYIKALLCQGAATSKRCYVKAKQLQSSVTSKCCYIKPLLRHSVITSKHCYIKALPCQSAAIVNDWSLYLNIGAHLNLMAKNCLYINLSVVDGFEQSFYFIRSNNFVQLGISLKVGQDISHLIPAQWAVLVCWTNSLQK